MAAALPAFTNAQASVVQGYFTSELFDFENSDCSMVIHSISSLFPHLWVLMIQLLNYSLQ
jgi:hypothetical protein